MKQTETNRNKSEFKNLYIKIINETNRNKNKFAKTN